MSLLSLLRSRENGCDSSGGSRTIDYCRIAEDLLIKSDESEISNQHLSTPLDVLLSNVVKSTIAIAMSPDGSTFATTHGDHTIKIFDYYTRKQSWLGSLGV
jgi:WD40 repeat protein